jgi:hypothetical protein
MADALRGGRLSAVDLAFCRAVHRCLAGHHDAAAGVMDEVLAAEPAGNAAWLLPIEPLLDVSARPECWVRPLARLRNRAA